MSGVSVNATVSPWSTTWGVDGAMLPLGPATGVMVYCTGSPPAQLCTLTSSRYQPSAPTEVSEPSRKRNCTFCPAMALTSTMDCTHSVVPHQACSPPSGLEKLVLIGPV